MSDQTVSTGILISSIQKIVFKLGEHSGWPNALPFRLHSQHIPLNWKQSSQISFLSSPKFQRRLSHGLRTLNMIVNRTRLPVYAMATMSTLFSWFECFFEKDFLETNMTAQTDPTYLQN
ncbi:hypothetical protein SCA6_019356 [Theobroma cacao]